MNANRLDISKGEGFLLKIVSTLCVQAWEGPASGRSRWHFRWIFGVEHTNVLDLKRALGALIEQYMTDHGITERWPATER